MDKPPCMDFKCVISNMDKKKRRGMDILYIIHLNPLNPYHIRSIYLSICP